MKEFEDILDRAEKNMGDPEKVFAVALVGLKNAPGMRIQEIMSLAKNYFLSHKEENSSSSSQNTSSSLGLSRAQRRAMQRSEKRTNNVKKKKNKKK